MKIVFYIPLICLALLFALLNGYGVVCGIAESPIGIVPAVAVTACAGGLIALVYKLQRRTSSDTLKALAGLAIATIMIYAGYLIDGELKGRCPP